uniref:Uncharacterized protein n=1 Tax=Arundo donax TaxID=35708 RepID=A0A0A9AN15_ARUDO
MAFLYFRIRSRRMRIRDLCSFFLPIAPFILAMLSLSAYKKH